MSEIRPDDGMTAEKTTAEKPSEGVEKDTAPVSTVKKVTKKGTTVKIIIKNTAPKEDAPAEEDKKDTPALPDLRKKPAVKAADAGKTLPKTSAKSLDADALERKKAAEERRARAAEERETKKKAEKEKRAAERQAEEQAYAERLEKAKAAVHERFRFNGRSGEEAYKKLFNRDNLKKKGKKAVAVSGERHTVVTTATAVPAAPAEKTRADILLERAAQKASIGTGFAKSKLGAVYAKLPDGVKSTCGKTHAACKRTASLPYVKLTARVLTIAALAVIAYVGTVFSSGIKALNKGGIFNDICAQYAVMKDYYLSGDVKALPETESATDISHSDTAVIYGVKVVSTCDMASNNLPVLTKSDKLSLLFAAGRNQAKASSLGIKLYAVAEAGAMEISPYAYSAGKSKKISFVTPPTRQQLDTVGCHILQIDVEGERANVVLIVRDTTPPAVSLRDVEIWEGEELNTASFIESITEISPVVVTFAYNKPNNHLTGEQLVYLDVTDIHGNKSELIAARLNVKTDTEPPEIKGAKDMTILLDSTPSYKKGITVTDNRDKSDDIKLTIDSSEINLKKEGKYKLIYIAEDTSGNVARKEITVRVAKKGSENAISLEEQVEKVAKSIFKDGMSDAQKVKAIYDWCRKHIGYSGHAKKDNYKSAAARGFKSRSGDCYTYFSCAKVLLEYCGIKNQDVVKVKVASSESSHYWSLVNVGTGWYHLDCTPRKGGFNGFMLTDKQLSDYSSKHKNSHRFDTSTHHSTPKEKFSM